MIKQALKYEASNLIFVHNHPSAIRAIQLRREITRDLVFACAVMQIRVLDHIVIGNNCYYSFADEGLIEKYQTHFYNVSFARAVDQAGAKKEIEERKNF